MSPHLIVICITKKIKHDKYLSVCTGKRTLSCYSWEYKLVQLLWENGTQVSQKLMLPGDLAIPHLNIYTK